jgi:ATP-dependent Lhr-like helicase
VAANPCGILAKPGGAVGKHERSGIHAYVSPLGTGRDIARNLEAPVHEMALPISIETRTGDTPHSKRKRQRNPPDILITTPEQVSLLIADQGRAYAAPSQIHHSG